MKQEIYEDQWEAADWDLGMAQDAKVEICDTLRWFDETGQLPPTEPVTAETYSRFGLPWFDYYREDMDALEETAKLRGLKSMFELGEHQPKESVQIAAEQVVAL
jgi:hypothetical protein